MRRAATISIAPGREIGDESPRMSTRWRSHDGTRRERLARSRSILLRTDSRCCSSLLPFRALHICTDGGRRRRDARLRLHLLIADCEPRDTGYAFLTVRSRLVAAVSSPPTLLLLGFCFGSRAYHISLHASGAAKGEHSVNMSKALRAKCQHRPAAPS